MSASAISVITKEFLQDIGATDNSTLLQYTTNAEVAGTRGTYAGLGNGTSVDETGKLRAPRGAQRVRGLAAADNTRDFFVTDIPWDSYNVDRIDISARPELDPVRPGQPGRHRQRLDAQRGVSQLRQRRVPHRLLRHCARQPRPQPGARSQRCWRSGSTACGTTKNTSRSRPSRTTSASTPPLRFDPQLFKDRSFHTSIKVKFENGDIKANRPRIVPPNDSITPWFRRGQRRPA